MDTFPYRVRPYCPRGGLNGAALADTILFITLNEIVSILSSQLRAFLRRRPNPPPLSESSQEYQIGAHLRCPLCFNYHIRRWLWQSASRKGGRETYFIFPGHDLGLARGWKKGKDQGIDHHICFCQFFRPLCTTKRMTMIKPKLSQFCIILLC